MPDIFGRNENGSPAHAGIDPNHSLAWLAAFWFPRTRGDRPHAMTADVAFAEVPPHTRG